MMLRVLDLGWGDTYSKQSRVTTSVRDLLHGCIQPFI